MRVSVTHDFVFLANPRCGSTSVRRALDPFCQMRGDPKRGGLRHHMSLRELEPVLEAKGHRLDRFWVFTTVRNPWDRVVYIYHYGLANSQSAWAPAAREAADLNAFVHSDILRHRFRPSSSDPALPGGAYTIRPFAEDRQGRLPCDVFRLEDMTTLEARLKERIDPTIMIGRWNRGERSDYRSLYDDAARQRVAWLFQSDIEAFDYVF